MDSMTLTGFLKKTAVKFPDQRAILVSGKFNLTHAQLSELVEHAASHLVAAGVAPSNTIALTFPSTVETAHGLKPSLTLHLLEGGRGVGNGAQGLEIGHGIKESEWHDFKNLMNSWG